MFNHGLHLQISDTARATTTVPPYANISGTLEHSPLYHSPVKSLSWLCLVDDFEMKWVDIHESLNDFIMIANSFHYSIKFFGYFHLQEYFLGYYSHGFKRGNWIEHSPHFPFVPFPNQLSTTPYFKECVKGFSHPNPPLLR